jgi:hypothetical protein
MFLKNGVIYCECCGDISKNSLKWLQHKFVSKVPAPHNLQDRRIRQHLTGRLLGLLINPEDVGSTFL